jgi:hypothetical protein
MVMAVTMVVACISPAVAQIFWGNQSPAGITDDIWCVTYANGSFAAVTSKGNLLTSSDGLTWSAQAIAPGTWLVSIAYGAGEWVAVGNSGTILVSSDLKTWSSAVSGTTSKLNGVTYTESPTLLSFGGGGVYIAVGENGTILTSPDAHAWSIQPSGVSGFLHGITYTENAPSMLGVILVSGQGGVLLEGFNALAPGFGPVSSGTSQNLEALFSNPNNGSTALAVGANGTFIGSNGGAYLGPWRAGILNPGSTATFRGLASGGGYFVAAGEQGSIFTSTDGINWTQRFAGSGPSAVSTSTLLSAAYSPSNQRFVVTGTGGTILASSAAPTVFGNVSTRGYVSSTQTFIGGFVIEGTSPRTVLIRADGPVLSAFGVPSPLPDPVLTVFNGAGTMIASDTGWTIKPQVAAGVPYGTTVDSIASAATQTGAFALPNPSSDSALLLTLQPGAYTAQITSFKGNSGIALFEAYTD